MAETITGSIVRELVPIGVLVAGALFLWSQKDKVFSWLTGLGADKPPTGTGQPGAVSSQCAVAAGAMPLYFLAHPECLNQGGASAPNSGSATPAALPASPSALPTVGAAALNILTAGAGAIAGAVGSLLGTSPATPTQGVLAGLAALAVPDTGFPAGGGTPDDRQPFATPTAPTIVQVANNPLNPGQVVVTPAGGGTPYTVSHSGGVTLVGMAGAPLACEQGGGFWDPSVGRCLSRDAYIRALPGSWVSKCLQSGGLPDFSNRSCPGGMPGEWLY